MLSCGCFVIALADYYGFFGLHLCITAVRQMMETAYFAALRSNTITYAEYFDVSVVNAIYIFIYACCVMSNIILPYVYIYICMSMYIYIYMIRIIYY
jgi:hypothetical protein